MGLIMYKSSSVMSGSIPIVFLSKFLQLTSLSSYVKNSMYKKIWSLVTFYDINHHISVFNKLEGISNLIFENR